MADPPRLPPRSPRPPAVQFRPQFTLLVLYFFGLFVFFCLLLALPALLDGARTLPGGSEPLTDAEKELAARITRDALRGRLPWALAATGVTLGLGLWAGALPGLPRRR